MRRIALTVLTLAVALPAAAGSLRFFGNGSSDIDRVKIRVDDPANANPGPPVDDGATDFTLEIWLRGRAADNRRPPSRAARTRTGSTVTRSSTATASTRTGSRLTATSGGRTPCSAKE